MNESYPCPHCSPFVPFRNKESLLVHLQREHNVNVLDAVETCEILDRNKRVLPPLPVLDIDLHDWVG